VLGALIALSSVLVAAPAQGTPALPLVLEWSAPQECPQPDEVLQAIRQRVGAVPMVEHPLHVSAVVVRDAREGWLLELRTEAGEVTGERTLTDRDCRQLSAAAILVLALMISRDAGKPAGDPPAPSALRESPPSPPATLPPPSQPAETLSTRRLSAGADFVLGTGSLPGAAKGVALRLAFETTHFDLTARVGGWLPRRAGSELLPGAGANLYLLEAGLGGCGHTRGRLSAQACAGLALARLHGQSFGVTDPGDSTAWWPLAFVEAAGRLHLGSRLRLRVGAEARGWPAQPRFVIGGLGEIYRPRSYNLRAGLGIELLF